MSDEMSDEEKLKFFIWGMADAIGVEVDEIDIDKARVNLEYFETHEVN